MIFLRIYNIEEGLFMRQKSHDLQYLEALHFRKGLTFEEEREYQKLLKGYQGELQFDRLCQYFSIEERAMIDDITLCLGKNVTQIDKIIVSGATLYLLDIKNYQGNYHYEKQTWSLNGNILSNNIFEQLRRAVRIVQQILNQLGINLLVKGVLVFINSDSHIEILDSVEELTLDASQIPQWLMSLQAQREPVLWQQALQTYTIPNYRTTRVTSPECFERLTKGIRCTHCGSFATKEQKRFSLKCSCGHVEPKLFAFLRTICEYSVIQHDVALKKKDVCQFVGIEYNPHYVREVLKNYFQLIPGTKRYENPGVCFDYLFKDDLEQVSAIEKRIFWKQ